jgi:predicted TPR repeat methyltransferase
MLELGTSRSARRELSSANDARDKRDWPSAVEHYKRYLDHSPHDAAIWVQYGHALKENGDHDAAIAAYERAIALNPGAADPHLHLGHVLKLAGKMHLAMRSYLQAAAADPAGYYASLELLALGWDSEELLRAIREGYHAAA